MRSCVDVGLHHELSQFLFFEAELLDDLRFEEWLALFAEDARYCMPIRTNRLLRERDRSLSTPGDLYLFDDDKESLSWRVAQLASDRHWAEDPPSRTRHLVGNVRASEADDGGFAVRSNFLCYRNRLTDEVDLWAGERHDLVHRAPSSEAGWVITQRMVLLDQSVVLSKNLSVFL